MQHCWTTSWGVSTRLIGGVIMTHGDDSGLILPPMVAPWQVVIVPIPRGDWKTTVLPKCEEIRDQLKAAGIRVRLDADESQTPGWKFAEYEMRGVPLRLEIGPKDIEKNAVFAARRDTRQKQSLPMDGLADQIKALLTEIQSSMLAKARQFRDEHTSRTASYDDFKQIMEGRPGFVISPWCESAQCEAEIKTETQATIRNMPFGQETPTEPCIKCGKPATAYAWFAKAY
jgi:prolyl-tRNA synthetase